MLAMEARSAAHLFYHKPTCICILLAYPAPAAPTAREAERKKGWLADWLQRGYVLSCEPQTQRAGGRLEAFPAQDGCAVDRGRPFTDLTIC
jgi:hypothetical protein